MRQTFRQKLSIVLVAAIVITNCPINVLAEESVQVIQNTEIIQGKSNQIEGENIPEIVQDAIDNLGEKKQASEVAADEMPATPSDVEYETTPSNAYYEITTENEEEIETTEATSSDAAYFDCTSEAIDGVKVTVTAEEGAFPAGSKLVVKKVAKTNDDFKDIEAAVNNAKIVEELSGEEENTEDEKETYTFDIKVVDKNGKEVQPTDESKVNVKFELVKENAKQITDAKVYHLEETDETKIEKLEEIVEKAEEASKKANSIEEAEDKFDYSLLDGDVIDNVNSKAKKIKDAAAKLIEAQEAEAAKVAKAESTGKDDAEIVTIEESSLVAARLDTEVAENEKSNVVVTTTDGFSYYVVEFYFGTYEYVLEGNSAIELQTILDDLHIPVQANTLTTDDIKVSNPTLFVPIHPATDINSNKFIWYIQALKPFSTEEWMKIKDYTIKVTDTNDEEVKLILDGNASVNNTFYYYPDCGPIENIQNIKWTISDTSVAKFSDSDSSSVETSYTGLERPCGHKVSLKGLKEGTATLTATFEINSVKYIRTTTVTVGGDIKGTIYNSSRKPNLFIVGWDDAWNIENGGDPIKWSCDSGIHKIVIDVKPEMWQRLYNNIDQANGILLGMYLDAPDDSVQFYRHDFRGGDNTADELMRSMLSSNPNHIDSNNRDNAVFITLMDINEDEDCTFLSPRGENAFYGSAWFTSNSPKTPYEFKDGEEFIGNFELIKFNVSHANDEYVKVANESVIDENWLTYDKTTSYVAKSSYQMGRLTYTLNGNAITDYTNQKLTTRLTVPEATDITFKRNGSVSGDVVKRSDGIYDIYTTVASGSDCEYQYEITYTIDGEDYRKILTILHAMRYSANDFDIAGFIPVDESQITFDATTIDPNRGFTLSAVGNGEIVTNWSGEDVDMDNVSHQIFVKAPAEGKYTGIKYWTAQGGGVDMHRGEDMQDVRDNTLLQQNRHDLINGGAYLSAFFLPERFDVDGRAIYSLACRSTGVDETDICIIAWEYYENDEVKYDFQYYYWTTEELNISGEGNNTHTSVYLPASVHNQTGKPQPTLYKLINEKDETVNSSGIHLDIKNYGQSGADENGGFDYYRIGLVNDEGKRVDLNGRKAVVKFSYPDEMNKEEAEEMGFRLSHYTDITHSHKNEESIRYEDDGLYVTLSGFSPFMLEWGSSGDDSSEKQYEIGSIGIARADISSSDSISFTYNSKYQSNDDKETGIHIAITEKNRGQKKYSSEEIQEMLDIGSRKIVASSSNQKVIPNENIELAINPIKAGVYKNQLYYRITPIATGSTTITFSSTDDSIEGSVSANVTVIDENDLNKPTGLTARASSDGTKLVVEWDNNTDSQNCEGIWIVCDAESNQSFGRFVEKTNFDINGNKASFEDFEFLSVPDGDEVLNVQAVFADRYKYAHYVYGRVPFESTTYTNNKNQLDSITSVQMDKAGVITFPSVDNAMGYRITVFSRESDSTDERGVWETWYAFKAKEGTSQSINIGWDLPIETDKEYRLEMRAIANQNEYSNSDIYSSDWMDDSDRADHEYSTVITTASGIKYITPQNVKWHIDDDGKLVETWDDIDIPYEDRENFYVIIHNVSYDENGEEKQRWTECGGTSDGYEVWDYENRTFTRYATVDGSVFDKDAYSFAVEVLYYSLPEGKGDDALKPEWFGIDNHQCPRKGTAFGSIDIASLKIEDDVVKFDDVEDETNLNGYVLHVHYADVGHGIFIDKNQANEYNLVSALGDWGYEDTDWIQLKVCPIADLNSAMSGQYVTKTFKKVDGEWVSITPEIHEVDGIKCITPTNVKWEVNDKGVLEISWDDVNYSDIDTFDVLFIKEALDYDGNDVVDHWEEHLRTSDNNLRRENGRIYKEAWCDNSSFDIDAYYYVVSAIYYKLPEDKTTLDLWNNVVKKNANWLGKSEKKKCPRSYEKELQQIDASKVRMEGDTLVYNNISDHTDLLAYTINLSFKDMGGWGESLIPVSGSADNEVTYDIAEKMKEMGYISQYKNSNWLKVMLSPAANLNKAMSGKYITVYFLKNDANEWIKVDRNTNRYEWVYNEEEQKWQAKYANGTYLESEFALSGSDWYFLGEDTYMVTDSIETYKDNQYYFDEKGKLVTSQTKYKIKGKLYDIDWLGRLTELTNDPSEELVEISTGSSTTQFNSLQEAIDAAKSGDTIKLVSDIEKEDEVYTIKAGVTLDVAGKGLVVDDLILNGKLTDTSDGEGFVKVKSGELIALGNEYMPLYDSSISTDGMNGYRLYKYGYEMSKVTRANQYLKFQYKMFLYNTNGTASTKGYELLRDDDEGGKLIHTTKISIPKENKNGQGDEQVIEDSYEYKFTVDDTRNYADNKAQNGKKVFFIRFNNYMDYAGKIIKTSSNWDVAGGYTFRVSSEEKYYKINADGSTSTSTKEAYEKQFEQ